MLLSIKNIKSGKNPTTHWWHTIYLFSSLSLACCLLQIMLPPPFGMQMTSAEVAESGIAPGGCQDGMSRCICPRSTVCATDLVSMILLAIARCSAFFDYPLYMMMFFSKCHNLNNILRRSVLREFIDFGDMHHIHSIFGVVIGIETMSHSFFHILRWVLNKELYLLWSTATGITGVLACSVTAAIVWPMCIPAMKRCIPFEARKCVHFLFWVWALALMWHAPSRIYYLIGVPLVIYCADFLVGLFVRTHLIENVYFERYGRNGVALQFKNAKRFSGSSKTSYVYIMCPWISKWQWHAFTVFPDPTKKDHTMVCIGASGDWTKEMYNKIKSPCHRTLFVLGPFASEFSDMALHTINALAIASGIGITPTLSLMLSYAGKKRINIIWMCRDAGLIEYFLHKIDIFTVTKNSFALIYYTGRQELVLPNNLPLNFFIFQYRPNLEQVISGIVAAIHSGDGLPEDIYEYQRAFASRPFNERIKIALSRVSNMYSEDEMFNYAVEATMSYSVEASKFEATFTTLSDGDEEKAIKRAVSINTKINEKLVSVHGLEAMISAFLGGIGDYSQTDIKHLFKQCDTDDSGYIDRAEFAYFIFLSISNRDCYSPGWESKPMSKSFSLTKRRVVTDSEEHTSTIRIVDRMIGDECTMRYMKKMVNDIDRPLDDWSMFYCGNSTPIVKCLRDIEKKYHVGLGIEKFDW